jgi:hypothetical protein
VRLGAATRWNRTADRTAHLRNTKENESFRTADGQDAVVRSCGVGSTPITVHAQSKPHRVALPRGGLGRCGLGLHTVGGAAARTVFAAVLR